MGSSTEHSAYGNTHNPWDLDRIPGGSGGGSAAAVGAYEAPLAIGTDTGGSIRQPAAVTGTVGVKPTYGGVSRYGLIALASSLDQAGPVTRTVLDSALLHELIGGHDPRDSTSINEPLPGLVRRRTRGRDRRPVRRARRRRHRAAGRGLPARRPRAVPRVAGDPAGRGRRDRRGLLPALHLRARGVLPDPARRGVEQPGQVRRHAVRPAGDPRGQPDGRARHVRHPRPGLRRRGQAPHHPGHLRPVGGLLRRLLRLGAEGPHAHPARLHRRVRAGRRARLPDGADHRVQAGREARRPAGHVPERRRDDPRQPRRHPGDVAAVRACPTTACRSGSRSWRPPRPTTGCTAWVRRSRCCSRPPGKARCC